MKKVISIVLTIIMIIGIICIPKTANASFNIESASLYSKGSYSDYLHYGDIGIVFNYVVYSKDGVEYPAYCLNKDLDGVTGSSSYSVSTDELLSDVRVWRAIINGYPYKTASELGCNTNEEAFIATKQAVYCMLYNREPSEYKANDERETRVLNAVTQIVTNAKNTTEIKQSSNLEIVDITNEWQQDNVENNYISKTFSVVANAGVNTYRVGLENITIEGARIVNEKNEDNIEFKYGENFKVLLPITSMQTEGNFNIKAEAQVATKPVLYGYSQNRNLQDYAITGNIYEDGNGAKTVYYTKNETRIIIVKKDEEGNCLEGVKFNLLNEEKQVVYSDLITNKEGEITINNLSPGSYYLEETSALNGYEPYSELMEVQVTYNETVTATITNSKEVIEVEKPKVIENNTQIEAKLPKTGM